MYADELYICKMSEKEENAHVAKHKRCSLQESITRKDYFIIQKTPNTLNI